LRADPNDPDLMFWVSVVSLSSGQTDFARQILERLILIDPLFSTSHLLIGYTDFFEGRLDDAINPIRKAYELGNEIQVTMWCLVRLLTAKGEVDEAIDIADQLLIRHPESPFAHMAKALILAFRGEHKEALSHLTPDVREWASNDLEWSQALSECYALAGKYDDAMDLLEKAVDNGFLNHKFLAFHNPFLISLRGSERFEKLMERVKRELSEFEATL
ncbi:hypothetical protein BVY01_01950, partial [bacterium I07]